MSKVVTIYKGEQNCISTKYPQERTVSIDCPYTGKGDEFSPGNLVESAVASCMLLSMGTLAMRDEIDISNTKVEVDMVATDTPSIKYTEINVGVNMARDYSDKDRVKLERAANCCPIKLSFDKGITINVAFNYPSS